MNIDFEAILTRLVSMEAKLDSYLFRTSKTEQQVESHDVRIRALETGTAKIMAGAGVFAFIATAFGQGFLQLFQ